MKARSRVMVRVMVRVRVVARVRVRTFIIWGVHGECMVSIW